MNSNILTILERAPITAFQRAVYSAVAGIPKGRTMTYAEIAKMVGKPGAVRAVGNVLNKNPFAPAVPCHRVVRSDGTMGGFAGGERKKRALLRSEGVIY